MKKRLFFALLCVAVIMSTLTFSSFAADDSTVAHWKFQNVDGYYFGTMNDDTFGFTDLSGNGNDLKVEYIGNAIEIDGGVFEWGKGSTLTAASDSSLYFGNTIDAAKSVDPYPSEETSYTGAHTSGMYFTTIDGAAINDMDFDGGFTIEAIIKMDATFNMNYNRYTGIFSRQGLYNNEPYVSLACAECDADSNGYFIGRMGMQYLLTDKNETSTLNNEIGYDSGIDPDVWVHMALVVDETGMVECFINGESVNINVAGDVGIGKAGYKWDVGVGRKDLTDQATHNENSPEGGIRRLFCGNISEIKVTSKALAIEDTLWGTPVNYTVEAPAEVAPVEETPAPVEETPVEETPAVEAPAPVEEAPAPVPTAPQTNDPMVLACLIVAASVLAIAFSRKKRVI